MRRTTFAVRAALVPLDFLALLGAGVVSYYLRFEGVFSELRPAVFELALREYLVIVLWVALFATGVFIIGGLYRVGQQRRFLDEVVRIFYGCSTVVLSVIVLIFFQRELFSSRFIILSAWLLSLFFVLIVHGLARVVERHLYARGIGITRLLVIGDDPETTKFLRYVQTHPQAGIGVISAQSTVQESDLESISEQLRQQRVEAVLVGDPRIPREIVHRIQIIADEQHVDFWYTLDRFDQPGSLIMTEVGGFSLIGIQRTPLEGWGRVFKRIEDVVMAVILLVLFSPLLLVCAVGIVMDSGRPILFSRLDDGSRLQRVGRFGQPFRYFKFRTMRPKSHALKYTEELQALNERKGDPLTKIKDDPRITRVGGWLRRFSLDELPELFLVLVGSMSLIGPRPHEPEEVARYTPEQRKLLRIKPGITGLAQVSGRSDLSFEEEVRLDMLYIEHWSLGMDIRIILRTPLAMIRRRQAD